MTITWNNYQPKVPTQVQNQYLDLLIDPCFQGVNKLFALMFEKKKDRKVNAGYYLPKVQIKEYNVMLMEKIFLISLLKVV